MTSLYQRSRTEGSLKSGGTWYERNQSGTITASGAGEPIGETKTTDDWVTRNFHKRSKSGEVIMNPYSFKSCTRSLVIRSNYKYYYNNNPSTWYELLGFPDASYVQAANYSLYPSRTELISLDEVARLTTEASTQCLSKIGRASTDSWENLAETNKTIAMLYNPIKSFMRFDRKFKIASIGLSAANAWMMYRYGISPLIRSVDDVLTALYRNVTPLRETSRGQATASANTVSTITYDLGWRRRVYRIQKTETQNVRAMSIDTVIRNIYTDLGFDSKSLLQLPWNLIPSSFVADWFFNVGDYIGALGQAFQPKSLGQCTVSTTVLSQVRNSISETSTLAGWVLTQQSLADWRQDNVFRTRDLGLSAPGIVVKADFRLDNATRVGDALALVGQRVLSSFLGRK